MNDGMWDNPATQANIAAIKARGVTVVDPDSGSLACGTEGKGRFAASEAIFSAVCNKVAP
jgi:phosphopantothenoylcysteine decarboxylase/phosphopantothenate--cysteine ligase